MHLALVGELQVGALTSAGASHFAFKIWYREV